MRSLGLTPPIGYDPNLQPTEEVVTTATRLRESIPWGALLAGVALGLLLAPRRRGGERRKRR
jgi:hypothetical protein